MSEATQQMIKLAQGDLCKILSQTLRKNHNSKLIFEQKEQRRLASTLSKYIGPNQRSICSVKNFLLPYQRCHFKRNEKWSQSLAKNIITKPWLQQEENRNAANTLLNWTDGKQTKSSERLNWCTVGTGVDEFPLARTFLFIFILDMERKLEVVEFFILGPSMTRLALSRMARQRMVGSTITMTTPRSSTSTCTRRLVQGRQQQDLSHCHGRLNLHLQSQGFFLAVSRPDSGNCHERDGECADNTSPAHFFSLRVLRFTHAHSAWLKV